jgi:hypothetical protein
VKGHCALTSEVRGYGASMRNCLGVFFASHDSVRGRAPGGGEMTATGQLMTHCSLRAELKRLGCPLIFPCAHVFVWKPTLDFKSMQRNSKEEHPSSAWWLVPMIPATWEAEVWRIVVQGQTRNKCDTLFKKYVKQKGLARGVTQVIDHLGTRPLVQNPCTAKKKKKKERKKKKKAYSGQEAKFQGK